MELGVPFNGGPRTHTGRQASLCVWAVGTYARLGLYGCLVNPSKCAFDCSAVAIHFFYFFLFSRDPTTSSWQRKQVLHNVHKLSQSSKKKQGQVCVYMLDEFNRVCKDCELSLHTCKPRSASACNENPSPGFFLMMDCSGWLLLGRVGVITVLQSEIPCVRPAGEHSCWPHDFSQVIHAVLIPTVMALSWGSAALPGPPRFSLWPPWQHCPSAACQPRRAWGGWWESGRG